MTPAIIKQIMNLKSKIKKFKLEVHSVKKYYKINKIFKKI